MTDNELILLFAPLIQNGLIARGLTDVVVQQGYDTTMQGTPTYPVVYFFKIDDHLHGSVTRKNVWDEEEEVMGYVETQIYETTYQVSALATQNPTAPGYTASDIVDMAASIMQSSNTINALIKAGVGILKISGVRNPYFVDERNRYEANPSFDFTLNYNRDIVSILPIVSDIDYLIESV